MWPTLDAAIKIAVIVESDMLRMTLLSEGTKGIAKSSSAGTKPEVKAQNAAAHRNGGRASDRAESNHKRYAGNTGGVGRKRVRGTEVSPTGTRNMLRTLRYSTLTRGACCHLLRSCA